MKLLAPFASVCIGIAAGCGSAPKSEPRVLAATEEEEPKETPEGATEETSPRQDLTDKVLEDERKAADVINDSLSQKTDDELAAWAAVYALRLGIKHDAAAAEKALAKGVAVDDPLLKALCWRWLASLGAEKLPKWSASKCDDPVVMAMAALAFAGRGKMPKELYGALGGPEGDPFGPDKRDQARERVETLLPLAAPFDSGPLVLAVAFAEARRGEWAEKGEGAELTWVCDRLRKELAGLVLNDDAEALRLAEKSAGPRKGCFTDLSGRLEGALIKHPRKMLHAIAVTGEPKLKIEALRAIAIGAAEPLAGDFGAAASALGSHESRVRLEAARTFLLLSMRSRK